MSQNRKMPWAWGFAPGPTTDEEMQMEKSKKTKALPAGVRKMCRDELRTLNYEPIFIPERLGWYIATDIIDGLDLYRGSCVYASYADYDVNWTAYCYPGVGGKAQ